MWRRFLQWVANRCRAIEIIEREDQPELGPYLYRYFLKRGHAKWSLYLHRFLRSDSDEGLHNHPARLGIGIILAGGYYEDRYGDRGPDGKFTVQTRWLGPGSINIIRGHDYHRVMLPEGKDCWSLFFRTGRKQPWGFMQPDGSFRMVAYYGPDEIIEQKAAA